MRKSQKSFVLSVVRKITDRLVSPYAGVFPNPLVRCGRLVAVYLFATIVSACGGGGGGGSDPSSTSPTATLKKGQFVDSPVANLEYQSGSTSGVTDSNGYFEYSADGDLVTFSIGGQILGTARTGPQVHVFDLASAGDQTDATRGWRIAQLLQTLDSDGDTTNGIQLSSQTKAIILTQPTIDFSLDAAAWDAQLQTLAAKSSTNVVPIAQAVEHAQSTISTVSSCVVANATFPFYDESNLGSFSTAGRSCDKKALATAFYEDVDGQMRASADEFRKSVYISDGETIAQRDVEMLARNNAATNLINVALDHYELLSVPGKNAPTAAMIGKVISTSTKLTKDFIALASSIPCTLGDSCGASEDVALKSTTIVLDIISKTADCASSVASKFDKCADAIKKSADLNKLLMLNYGDVPAEQVAKMADLAAAWMASIVDGLDAIKDPSIGSWAYFASSMIDVQVKTQTNFYLRSDQQTATRGTIYNNLEVGSEALKTFVSCAIPIAKPALASPQEVGRCLGDFTKYFNQRSAEIGAYLGVMAIVGNLNQYADDMDMARIMLSEIFHYGSFNAMVAHYGWSAPSSPGEVVAVVKQILPVLATKVGKDNASARYSTWPTFMDRVIDNMNLFTGVIRRKADAILAGRFTSCRSVQLGEIDSPQFIKKPFRYELASGVSTLFTAAYQPVAASKGFIISFGDGSNPIVSDLPAAEHTFTVSHGQVTIVPTITGVNGTFRTCESKRQTVSFAVKNPAPINKSPAAAFTLPSSGAINTPVTFDANTSADVDGSITAYAWNFGDGATGSGKTASHAYTIAKTYVVTLTVTDDKGASSSIVHTVDVIATAVNATPTAAFTPSASTTAINTAITFDASTSADSDGSISSYSWDFGDGTAKGSGKIVSHSYTTAKASAYNVTLTVTDNLGATATATKPITITATPKPDLVPSAVTLSSPTVAPGATVTVNWTHTNSGNANAATSTTELRLLTASDAINSPSATLVLGVPTGALAIGASVSLNQIMTIPATTAPGSYKIVVVADSGNSIGQGNVANDYAGSSAFSIGPVANPMLTNPSNGHRYEIIVCGTWTQCNVAAKARGGNLVTIRSKLENDWILANFGPLANSQFGFWIGLNAPNGTWSWSSGATDSYTNWAPNEPNTPSTDVFANMYTGIVSPGAWNNTDDNARGVGVVQAIVEYSLADAATSCSAPATSIAFSEDFSATLDASKWAALSRGGLITSGGGVLAVSASANSATYPYLESVASPIPTSGNYSLYCKGRYAVASANYGAFMCGAVRDGIPLNHGNSEADLANSLFTFGRVGVVSSGLYPDIGGAPYSTILPGAIPTAVREIEMCVIGSTVTIYQDRALVGTTTLPANTLRPKKLFIGNPSLQLSGDWVALEVQKIQVRSLGVTSSGTFQ